MEDSIVYQFQNYIKNYKTLSSDVKGDMNKINALGSNDFYYCFTDLPIDQWGARYKKEEAYYNLNIVYTTLNSIPSYLASSLLPKFQNSTTMSIYARQKLEALGPWGVEGWEFDKVMNSDQRKAAAGVPSGSTVTEVLGKN